ncbi:MAG: hypothetical protein WBA41_20945 [Rivularia sp. (in: cyanobacteria)]
MHQLTEAEKFMLLAIGSGVLGGLIKEVIRDFISKIKNQLARNTAHKVKSYIAAGFFYGIGMGVFIFAALMFDTTIPIQENNKVVLLYIIIGQPLINLVTQRLESLFVKSQNN